MSVNTTTKSTTYVQPEHIFLVSGIPAAGESVQQTLVLAPDATQATDAVLRVQPGMQVLGLATLADYERTAQRMRAALQGSDQGWLVIRA